MDQKRAEEILNALYAARVKGDVDAALQDFAEDGVFTQVGAASASRIPNCCRSLPAVREGVQHLMAAFDFLDHEVVSFLYQDGRAAVHARFRVRANHTGAVATTESADFVTFRDGKISEFTQFCDTALAEDLLAGAAA
jgi:ketosteroid isomerase-like protein